MKTLLSLFIITTFLVANENNKCIVPNILIETIKITENERKYPFLIRTNETSTLKDFKDIASSFEYKKTKDNMVIDCINLENCSSRFIRTVCRSDSDSFKVEIF